MGAPLPFPGASGRAFGRGGASAPRGREPAQALASSTADPIRFFMTPTRLEAFSDGVIAILITIMVLELKVPEGHDLTALRPMLPVGLAYVLSFVFLGIYWNNHHHMFKVVERVNGPILWANLHLLFWLSLVPAATHWMGESHGAPLPIALYGVILLMSGAAYSILQHRIVAHEGRDSKLAKAIETGGKEKMSLAMYLAAIPLAWVHAAISYALFVTVALIWLRPDPRIEALEKMDVRGAPAA